VLLSGQTKSLNPKDGPESPGLALKAVPSEISASGASAGSTDTSGRSVALKRDGPADACQAPDPCGAALFPEPAPDVFCAPVCMTFAAPSVQFRCGPGCPPVPVINLPAERLPVTSDRTRWDVRRRRVPPSYAFLGSAWP
jgi:hypothetical protein